MTLSINEVLDYLRCPLFYAFKYVENVPEDNDIQRQVSENLHKIIYHYFFRLMNNHIPTLRELKVKWEEMWFKGIDPIEYILRPRDEKTEAGQRAVPLIETFYNENITVPCIPVAVDLEYEIEIGDHIVTGNIEVAREVQEGPRRLIEIVDYRTGTQVPSKWLADNDLNLSFQSYAFRQKFKAKEQRILYHYLRTNKKIDTYRDESQYLRASLIIEMVAKSLSRGIFYPRQTYACNTCGYKKMCSAWGAQDQEEETGDEGKNY